MYEMTLYQGIVGWVGTLLFFCACWLLGSKSMRDRRDGIFGFVCVNLCFILQASSMGNWPLLTMSAVGVLFQTRAWANWDKYDESNDIRSD